jgi:hypothetical protein
MVRARTPLAGPIVRAHGRSTPASEVFCDGAWRFATRSAEERRTKMPQQRWSEKDERKYEHIKEGARKRGTPTERAKEIAARTVNKQRREEGRTPNKRTQGTGNPRTPLEQRTKDELMNRARQLGVNGISRMNKRDLLRAIEEH